MTNDTYESDRKGTAVTDAERKRMAEQWMTAFVAMWTERNDQAQRHRDAIEDAIKRLEDGAPAWDVVSRLRTHLDADPYDRTGKEVSS